METDDGVEVAGREKAEASDLIAEKARETGNRRYAGEIGDVWKAKHPALLIQIAQVRHLDHLRASASARRASVGSKEPGKVDVELCVAGRIEAMAALARRDACRGHAVHEDVFARGLIWRQRVVEITDRVRWIHHLQDEVTERLHVGISQRGVPA